MTTRHYCDRCGKEGTRYKQAMHPVGRSSTDLWEIDSVDFVAGALTDSGKTPGKRWDICSDCRNGLISAIREYFTWAARVLPGSERGAYWASKEYARTGQSGISVDSFWRVVPELAEWVAMDSDGDWFWYSNRPEAKSRVWASDPPFNRIGHDVPLAYQGLTWTESLFHRP